MEAILETMKKHETKQKGKMIAVGTRATADQAEALTAVYGSPYQASMVMVSDWLYIRGLVWDQIAAKLDRSAIKVISDVLPFSLSRAMLSNKKMFVLSIEAGCSDQKINALAAKVADTLSQVELYFLVDHIMCKREEIERQLKAIPDVQEIKQDE